MFPKDIAAALTWWSTPLTAISVIASGVVWVTLLYSSSNSNSKDIERLSKALSALNEELENAEERIARLEGSRGHRFFRR